MSVKDMTENLHSRIDAVTAAAYKAGELKGFKRGKEVGLDENEGYGAGFSSGRIVERERLIDAIDKKTGHYASTHYAGKNCQICRVFEIMLGEEE